GVRGLIPRAVGQAQHTRRPAIDAHDYGGVPEAFDVVDDGADAVTQLTDLTGTVPVLLTGDNLHAAAHIADELGIRDVRAGL
ncbi:heavy metal translocating P-type ATPase, partial [Mycobacterium sp. ITM-2017-0098]